MTSKAFIDFDYLSLVQLTPAGFKMRYNNKLLLSPSKLMRLINEINLFPVPKKILEERRNNGENLMRNIKFCYDNKLKNWLDCNPTQADIPYLNTFFNAIKEKQLRIRAVEKFITNGTFCGYVDLVVRGFKNYKTILLEIKTRNNVHEVRQTDLFQLYIYHKITNLSAQLLVINNRNEGRYYTLEDKHMRAGIAAYKKLFKFFNVDNKLSLKPFIFSKENK